MALQESRAVSKDLGAVEPFDRQAFEALSSKEAGGLACPKSATTPQSKRTVSVCNGLAFIAILCFITSTDAKPVGLFVALDGSGWFADRISPFGYSIRNSCGLAAIWEALCFFDRGGFYFSYGKT